jgi:hypothetical protein
MIEILDLGVNSDPLFVGNYSTESLIADVQVEGSRLYALLGPKWENGVVTESSVQILDISNPTSPRLTGTANEIGLYAEAMAVTERFIYLGTMGDMWPPQFKVFNVDEPGSPRVEGILDLRAPAVGIALFQSYAGVVDNSGLTIIDLKDLGRPNAVGTYDPGFASTDIAVLGEYALLTHSAGFDVIDLTNPQKPDLVARVKTPDPVSEVGIDGNHAYIVTREGLRVFDISVPSNPSRVGGHTFAARWDFTFDPDFSYEPVGVNIAKNKVFARSRHAIFILNKYQPLRFGEVLRQGVTNLQLSGPPGVSAWVQRSHELEEWENWKLVAFQDRVVELGDVDADSEVKRFYRMTVPSIRAPVSDK